MSKITNLKTNAKPFTALAAVVLFPLLVLPLSHHKNDDSVNKIVIHGYSDRQICQALYFAEGGDKTKYPYGIRSVHCGTKAECQKVCEATVRNNRIRFARHGSSGPTEFIKFLRNVYCSPSHGDQEAPRGIIQERFRDNVSRDQCLNWEKNVIWFLNHPKSR